MKQVIYYCDICKKRVENPKEELDLKNLLTELGVTE